MNKTTASMPNKQMTIGKLKVGKPHIYFNNWRNIWICGDYSSTYGTVHFVGSLVYCGETPKEAYENWVKRYGEYTPQKNMKGD